MQKQSLALYIKEEDYRNRMSSHLLMYEKNRLGLHIFTEGDQLRQDSREYDFVICAGDLQETFEIAKERKEPFFYLYDDLKGMADLAEYQKRITLVDKYQNVNRILDEILKHVGEETLSVGEVSTSLEKMRMIAVYGLAETEYQLPFLATLASILGEEERVLLLDLQENSGFSHLQTDVVAGGLEELLAMVESGKLSKSRLLSGIGHFNQVDYIAPAENSECLSEVPASLYLKLLHLLGEEQEYSLVLINMGSRFPGFFEFLNQCKTIYLITKKGGLCQWREYEFEEEAKKKGYSGIPNKTVKVEIPAMSISVSCERLVEQWKWNEIGDMIRRMLFSSTTKRSIEGHG